MTELSVTQFRGDSVKTDRVPLEIRRPQLTARSIALGPSGIQFAVRFAGFVQVRMGERYERHKLTDSRSTVPGT